MKGLLLVGLVLLAVHGVHSLHFDQAACTMARTTAECYNGICPSEGFGSLRKVDETWEEREAQIQKEAAEYRRRNPACRIGHPCIVLDSGEVLTEWDQVDVSERPKHLQPKPREEEHVTCNFINCLFVPFTVTVIILLLLSKLLSFCTDSSRPQTYIPNHLRCTCPRPRPNRCGNYCRVTGERNIVPCEHMVPAKTIESSPSPECETASSAPVDDSPSPKSEITADAPSEVESSRIVRPEDEIDSEEEEEGEDEEHQHTDSLMEHGFDFY